MTEEHDAEQLNTGNIGDNGCPCGKVQGDGYTIISHCWRTRDCCEYSGVHYSDDKGREHAEKIADWIQEVYGTGVDVSQM